MANLIRFGDFVLDRDQRQLTRRGEPVAVQPKVLDLLALLLERHPAAVHKRHIYETLWPDVIVEEANVHNLISELRSILDDGERKSIRTVHRYGYAFAGPVEVSSAWELRIGDRRFILAPGPNVIGRDEDADVCIDAPGISRRHARIAITTEGAFIEDLESKNGTFVDGRRIAASVPLDEEAEILFAQVLGRLRKVRSHAPTITL